MTKKAARAAIRDLARQDATGDLADPYADGPHAGDAEYAVGQWLQSCRDGSGDHACAEAIRALTARESAACYRAERARIARRREHRI